MTKALGSLMSSSNSLKIKSPLSGATFLGVPVYTLGGDNNTYDMTPEIHKALSSTYYTGKTTKNENDVLMSNNNIRDLCYIGRGDRQSDRKIFFPQNLSKLNEEIQNNAFDEITDDSDDLQREGVKIIKPSTIIDIYTRLETLLGLKLSGHTDTITEASNLIDEIYKG